MTSPFGGPALITGIGQSQIGRKIGRDGVELTIEAALAAIADAGLTPDDIDGVATFPGAMVPDPGFTGGGVNELTNALGLRLSWFGGAMETAGQLGPVIEACMAVACGLATHVVVFRSVWEATAQMGGGRGSTLVGGEARRNDRAAGYQEFSAPFGAVSPANWLAMPAQRYMHEFGLTREQLGQIAVNARRNAALNPNAIYTDPMTLDDYLASRMISYPFCLYDCDVPCDGATAVIVSRAEAAAGLPQTPIVIESGGSASYGRFTWDQRADLTTMTAHDSAASMWDRTTLSPKDVQLAELYDGFSYLTLMWLEALGFCGHGEAGRFIEGGERIALTGELPINTQGGQLSGGRLHGMGFLHEACVQLRGEGGARQVAGSPTVAVAAAGGGPVAGCLLLRL